MTTTTKLMPLAEMTRRWAVMTLWTGRGMEPCHDCGEKYPVLYMNAQYSPEPRCRGCFCKHMLEVAP
jgi:hypothetical protein